MGQYFYRPVESGYAEMGRGIGRGVEKSADILIAGKERDRQRKREDLELDVMLGKMGGGRGPRPTERYQPGERSTSVNADGIRMPTGLQAMETRDKPGFIESGDGDFYFEDPTRRAERLERESYGLGREREAEAFELGRGREADARTLRGETLGAAGQALMGRGPREPTEEDYEAFYEYGQTPPKEEPDRAPVEGTPEWYDWYERRATINADVAGGAARDKNKNMTQAQAMDFLEEFFTEPGEYRGEKEWKIDPEQVPDLATALTQGIDIFAEGGPLDTGRRPDPGAMAGYPEGDIESVATDPRQHLPGFLRNRGGPRAGGGQPAAAPAAAAPAAAPAGAGLTEIDQDRWDFLREVRGMTDEDIARIYVIG